MNNPDRHKSPSLPELRKLINAELTRCLSVVEREFGRRFPRPYVTFDLKGLRAGSASLLQWHIRLNPIYFNDHLRETIEQTVPHEFAHLVDFSLHPDNFIRRKPRRGAAKRRLSLHGKTWKAIMCVLGVKPERCHSMYVPGMKRRIPKRYSYSCPNCKNIVVVGPRHHKLLQRGNSRAILKDCGHYITGADCIGLIALTGQRQRG